MERSHPLDGQRPLPDGMAMTWRSEWPTWLVVMAAYGGWGVLTWYYNALPWWIVLPCGALLIAWHNSLQHEALHGHPTANTLFNTVLAGPPLGLWMPYAVYRETHLRHHRIAALTCPVEDPESYYVTAEDWRAMGAVRRAILTFNNTLFGRLTVGPGLAAVKFWHGDARRLAAGDLMAWGLWLSHGVFTAIVLYWVMVICDIPLFGYIALFAYPGLSLTLTRSYLEHRPAANQERRTVLVEAGPLPALLYLNNNLHAVHHRWPGMAWYLLPRAYRAAGAALRAENGGYTFNGYGDVARRFLWRPKDLPQHPG